jgi:hypothetical protein
MDEVAILLLVCLFIACLIAAAIGFGDALIAIPLLAFFIDVRLAIVLISFWGIFLNIANCWKYWAHLDFPYVKKVVLGGIPGVVLGSLLISILPLYWIEFVLGSFLFIYVGVKFCAEWRKGRCIEKMAENRPFPDRWLYFGGFNYGFFGGLISASGPISVILLEQTKHERESFIENFAATSLFLTIIKLGIFLGTGLFPTDLFGVFLIGIPLIFLACSCGYRITPKIPVETFRKIILGVLFIIAIRFLVESLSYIA